MAVLVVIGPIFEADLSPRQYGFRPGLDAKMAVRMIHFGITQRGKREVVDADLSDYFNTIPHGDPGAALSLGSPGLPTSRQWPTILLAQSPQAELALLPRSTTLAVPLLSLIPLQRSQLFLS
jgi:hypothetical protein